MFIFSLSCAVGWAWARELDRRALWRVPSSYHIWSLSAFNWSSKTFELKKRSRFGVNQMSNQLPRGLSDKRIPHFPSFNTFRNLIGTKVRIETQPKIAWVDSGLPLLLYYRPLGPPSLSCVIKEYRFSSLLIAESSSYQKNWSCSLQPRGSGYPSWWRYRL